VGRRLAPAPLVEMLLGGSLARLAGLIFEPRLRLLLELAQCLLIAFGVGGVGVAAVADVAVRAVAAEVVAVAATELLVAGGGVEIPGVVRDELHPARSRDGDAEHAADHDQLRLRGRGVLDRQAPNTQLGGDAQPIVVAAAVAVRRRGRSVLDGTEVGHHGRPHQRHQGDGGYDKHDPHDYHPP